MGFRVPCRYSSLGLILLFSFATVLQAVLTGAQYDIAYAVLGCGFAVSHNTDRRARLGETKEKASIYIYMCVYIYIYAGEAFVCPHFGLFEGHSFIHRFVIISFLQQPEAN